MSLFLQRICTPALHRAFQKRTFCSLSARTVLFSEPSITHSSNASSRSIRTLFRNEKIFSQSRAPYRFEIFPRLLAVHSKLAASAVLQEVIDEQKFDESELQALLQDGKWEFSVQKEHLLLKRQWSEKEQIHVWIQIEVSDDEKTEKNETVEDSSNPLATQRDIFTIQIIDTRRQDHMLEFFCEAVAGQVEIDEVVITEGEVKYQMYFNELEDKVQDVLISYLTERGLYDDTLPRLVFLLLNRYDHDYHLNFLKSLQTFIKA